MFCTLCSVWVWLCGCPGFVFYFSIYVVMWLSKCRPICSVFMGLCACPHFVNFIQYLCDYVPVHNLSTLFNIYVVMCLSTFCQLYSVFMWLCASPYFVSFIQYLCGCVPVHILSTLFSVFVVVWMSVLYIVEYFCDCPHFVLCLVLSCYIDVCFVPTIYVAVHSFYSLFSFWVVTHVDVCLGTHCCKFMWLSMFCSFCLVLVGVHGMCMSCALCTVLIWL